MNTIFSSPKKQPGIEPVPSEEVQVSITPFYHETNITEGSEFLDDAIRIKEQPLEETPIKENQ